jgi:hypothetical protein
VLLDWLLANATTGKTRMAVAIMAAAVRAVGGHALRGRRMTRVLWFIMPSSGLEIVPGASVAAVAVLNLNVRRSSASAQVRTVILPS